MSTESIGAPQARSRERSRLAPGRVGPEPIPRRRRSASWSCTVMVAPLVLGILASLKSTGEAAAQPPTYFPTR